MKRNALFWVFPLAVMVVSAPDCLASAGVSTRTKTLVVSGIESAGSVVLESKVDGRRRVWLQGPFLLEVRRETDGAAAFPIRWDRRGSESVARLGELGLTAAQRWVQASGALAWEFDFTGAGKRTGHAVTINLDVLSPALRVYTPSEQGIVDVPENPDYHPLPYANMGSETHRPYVLPLLSIMDAKTDSALTIALPPDVNIPHFQIEWTGARRLTLRFAHRAMGGAKVSRLRLLFYAHAADYRCALKAYSDDFPAYFRPPLPRGAYEGAFYYHHIHNHPDFEEMARQKVHYLWSSFWFTHLGEYLPAESEWYPYTFAKWWRFGEKMSDLRINEFVAGMQKHGIGVYAYFNVTEYGGAGDRGGNAEVALRQLKEQFAGALIQDEKGAPIPTWEGSMAMNPGPAYPLWPFLREQVRRQLQRLPGIEGFVIDRLDWASRFDFAHDDGFSMAAGRPVENMAVPVASAVQGVSKLAHEAGKRVFVNQFYRIELLRDVDGYCHEHDFARSIGYLAPFRPASAWELRRKYDRDLLEFEAQLKTRLQYAVFPHMIARTFAISQQKPNERAAGMLEIYAPLFEALMGKQQVLLPHCITATGANDANLFRNPDGQYVVPLTSRLRFLSAGDRHTERVVIAVRTPDAAQLAWARVYSADGPPYRATLRQASGAALVQIDRHATASLLVLGPGEEPKVSGGDMQVIAVTRDKLFPGNKRVPARTAEPPGAAVADAECVLRIRGRHVAEPGGISVLFDGRRAGRIPEGAVSWEANVRLGNRSGAAPCVRLVSGDEGTWFRPGRIELLGRAGRILAEWTVESDAAEGLSPRDLQLPLRWKAGD